MQSQNKSLIVAIVAVLVVGGIVAYKMSNKQSTPQNTTNAIVTSTPVPTPTSSVNKAKATPTAISKTATKTPVAKTTTMPGIINQSATYLDESYNNKTITLSSGKTVTVILNSTFWKISGSTNDAALSAVGEPVIKSIAPGNGCLEGQGCGNVSQVYVALRSGTATLSASRTTCGVDLACPPESKTFKITVNVI